MPPSPALGLLSLLLPLSTAIPAAAQASHLHRFAREDVLGTSSLLVVEAPDEAAAAAVAAAVFGEVERLRGVLSTWDETTELSRLVQSGGAAVSEDLGAVLRLAAQWRDRTGGAFDPGVAALTALWSAAAARDREPAKEELAAAVAALQASPWSIEGPQATLPGPISVDALAKGHIVDRAVHAGNAARADALVRSFQIGGDMLVGAANQDVAVVDPRNATLNGTPLATVRLAHRAIASSGGYERGFRVGPVHHSHILDPRTGRPCDHVLGATVVAPDATTADALATVLCVLGPERGLPLLAKEAGVEAIVVTADGVLHPSSGWPNLAAPDAAAPPPRDADWPDGFALQVEFEIQAPAASGTRQRGGWKRPYVAVWIEDLTGAPARTLCLWIEDRRWLRDLRRWSRQHADDPRLADLVSGATRKAGKYTLTWDGTDDEGRRLAPGRYTVYLEAVREHGTYQLSSHAIELGADAVTIDLAGQAEIARATLHFGRGMPATGSAR